MQNWITLTGSIAVATLILGTVVCKAARNLMPGFWNDRVRSMEQVLKRTHSMTKGTVCGAKMSMQKTTNGAKEIIRVYIKVDDHWEETTTTRIIQMSEVPAEVLATLSYSAETDITDMLKAHLDVAETDIASILEGHTTSEEVKE